MKLFSGTANPRLANEVARLLNIEAISCEVVQFGNSELRVRTAEQIEGENCIIIQSTCNPTNDHIIELLFIADALERGKAKEIHTVIPYFGYSRQHTQFRPGETVSTQVILKLIEVLGIQSIVTVDPHQRLQADKLSINTITAMPTLAHAIKPHVKGEAVVVSPDEGGRARAETFAHSFFNNKVAPIVYVTKHRDKEQINIVAAQELHGDVGGKTAIIVDDIITSGKTLVAAADLCRQHGATHIIAAATHADFIDTTVQTLSGSAIQHLFITDSIQTNNSILPNNSTTISIAPLIAEKLKVLSA